MSHQVVGKRELELRRMREEGAKHRPVIKISRVVSIAEVAATLPPTSGKKPVKRKAKPRAHR